MTIKKYICTKDVVRLTGLTTEDIYDLIHSGKLPAHKAPKSGWRISPQDLAALGLIQEETDSIEEDPQMEDCVSYVADEEHYTEVFKRMTEVKRSLKIATGDLKNFTVAIETDGPEVKFRLCDFFLSLVERGVHVQVVSMKPLLFYLYSKKNCPQLLESPLFELRENGHSHMKIFIFDDECFFASCHKLNQSSIDSFKRSFYQWRFAREYTFTLIVKFQHIAHSIPRFETVPKQI